jgi:TRAP-type mannitol/chloroaromatic compound transport system substrate-binding protein
MKKKKLFRLGSVALVATLIGFFSFTCLTSSADAKVYRWKIQSGYPHGDLSFELLKGFAASAEKKSNGQLKITVFADPEIVPLEQLFDATKRGTLDMLHAAGAFWGGIIPVGEVEFGIPYGFRVPEAKTFKDSAEIIRKFFFKSGFVDLLREEYGKQKLYWLDMHTYGPVPFVVATKPIKTCEDLKGVKIRDEGLYTNWHNMLGARGTYISGGEAYMALKLGTLDAAQWDVSCITGLKWHEVAPYWIRGEENDHCIGHILVNMKSWNALPDNLKKALKDAAKDYWDATVKGYGDEIGIVEDMVKKGTLKECQLDKDCINKHAEAAYKLWDEVAGRDPASAKAIQMIKKWRNVR